MFEGLRAKPLGWWSELHGEGRERPQVRVAAEIEPWMELPCSTSLSKPDWEPEYCLSTRKHTFLYKRLFCRGLKDTAKMAAFLEDLSIWI